MGIFKSRFSRIFITLALLGVVCFVMGIYELVGASSFKADINKNIDNSENIINYMYQSDYKLKENVCGDILYLFEAYCEETTTHTVNGIETSSNVSGTYYLMPIINYEDGDDNTYYVTVVARNSDFRQSCEMLVDNTYAFLGGEEDIDWTDCVFYGKVKPLEDDVKLYLKEFVNEFELFENASDYNKYILPFELEDYNYDKHMSSGWLMLAIGVGLIAVSAVIFIVYKNKSSSAEEISYNEETESARESFLNVKPIDEENVRVAKPKEQAVINVEPTVAEVKEEKVPENKEPEAVAGVTAGEMLTANVSADELDTLPDDGASKPAFNYDDDGMGGIDVSALDLSTLGEYSEEKPAENDDNIYTDDEDYTFDADPSSIQLSEMDN